MFTKCRACHKATKSALPDPTGVLPRIKFALHDQPRAAAPAKCTHTQVCGDPAGEHTHTHTREREREHAREAYDLSLTLRTPLFKGLEKMGYNLPGCSLEVVTSALLVVTRLASRKE